MGWVGVLSITTQPPVVESHQSVREVENTSQSIDPKDKVVQLFCGKEIGSGVIMDWGWVVTAKHVVKECPVGSPVWVRWMRQGETLDRKQLKVLALDKEHDLALLENTNQNGLEVGAYEAGNAVSIGYPANTKAEIPVLIKPDNNRIKLTQEDLSKIRIRPGLSGGALIQNNRLVGIVVTAWVNDQGDPTGTGFAVQSSDIDNFIQSYKKEKGL